VPAKLPPVFGAVCKAGPGQKKAAVPGWDGLDWPGPLRMEGLAV
jgi:hypothetical protein